MYVCVLLSVQLHVCISQMCLFSRHAVLLEVRLEPVKMIHRGGIRSFVK